MQTLINSFCVIMFIATMFAMFLFLRGIHIQLQLDRYNDLGYKLATFKSKKEMFWKFWILDAKRFTTTDTFLERL